VLTTLARALRFSGRSGEARPLELRAEAIRGDFQRRLVVDEVLTGYALFGDGDGDGDGGGGVRHLLHPRDQATGVHYSSLAMIHAILEDLLSPAQVDAHLRVIESHLHASDGIRLFDRPMPYHGGPQRLFQRAESATYFGREIGLMYMHAHLRFAQALAHLGRSQAFFDALCQANPIGIQAVVPAAAPRQANCYYSSSDATFADRAQASADYDRVREGRIAFEGGWRVYSSGAGILLGLIVRHFLGLGQEAGVLVFDPVIPGSLDGLTVDAELAGRPVGVRYRIGARGCGVSDLRLNGQRLAFQRDSNPHRPGAVRVPVAAVQPLLTGTRDCLEIWID
jgi:1,2-beta-oligoglucan phosphorylase